MTIYVDPPKHYPNTTLRYAYWSHMATDQDDLTELHEFALKIGLKREWFQDHRSVPHYDIVPSKRKKALALGAVAVSSSELVLRCSRILEKLYKQRIIADLESDTTR